MRKPQPTEGPEYHAELAQYEQWKADNPLPVGSEWYAPGGSGTHHDIQIAAEKAALRGRNAQRFHKHAKEKDGVLIHCVPECEMIDYRDLPEWEGTGIAVD